MSQKVNITSPVGRIVQGSLYEPQTTDMQGKPLIIKTGPNAGQPRKNYSFAIAIPKNPGETHWAHTEWGKQIWHVGHQAYPQQAPLPGFAWKVVDGDDVTPSMKSKPPGKRPCDNEGYKGNWIIKFSAGFAPKIYQLENGVYVQNVQPDFIKPGYFVQVAFSVEGNTGESPGVYLNHSMVCFSAYGPEINFGPDVASAGFGQAPLPPGASVTPLAGTAPLPNAGVAAPVPGYAPVAAGTPPPPMGYAHPAAPVPVAPNTQFVQVPPPTVALAPAPSIPVIMPPPAALPAAPVRQMTPAAQGATYESLIAVGWTDALLVQHGMMLA